MSLHDHEAIFGISKVNRLKDKFCHKCLTPFKKGDLLLIKPNGTKSYHKKCWEKLFL